MFYGIPFYGTGAAAPTAHNATLKDPILEATITTVALRGKSTSQRVMGVSFVSDVPALGSRLELRIGNQPTPARVIDVFPFKDGDLVSIDCEDLNYHDLGGIPIEEDELIDIRLFDPGAAENMSGVLWMEDDEPNGPTPIPAGNLITLKCGGTNDAGTTLATTGFDADSRKLVNERLYTIYEVVVRPEDKVAQWIQMAAGKDVAVLPPAGKVTFPYAPLQFTGAQWNQGSVIGKVQVQAATKVEIIVRCIESPIEGKKDSPNAPPMYKSSPSPVKGVSGPGDAIQGSTRGGNYQTATSGRGFM